MSKADTSHVSRQDAAIEQQVQQLRARAMHPLHIRYQEVGMKESGFDRVGGGT